MDTAPAGSSTEVKSKERPQSRASSAGPFALGWALLGLHAAIPLVLLIPRTIVRLVRALAPNGQGVSANSFLAFSAADMRARPWYVKIARDLANGGRAGFVWNDGFGTPMGVRFYNNTITFALYRKLGPRWYASLSLLLFLAGILIPAALEQQLLIGSVLCLLVVGSPLFIASQLHMGKPEVLWWAFLAPLVYCAWTNHWLAAGLIFSIVAFGNFAAAFLHGVAILLLLVTFWPGVPKATLLLAGMTPGLAKTFVRLVPFLRAGLLGSITSEQADAAPSAGRGWLASLQLLLARDLLFYSFFLSGGVLLALWSAEHAIRFGLLFMATWAVYFAGQKLFYLNDPQSFWLWHLGLLSSLVVTNPSWLGVMGVTFYAYMHPVFVGLPVPDAPSERGWRRWVEQGRQGRALLADFPYLTPLSRAPIVEPMAKLFAAVPANARILMESRSPSREMGGYRTFVQLSEEVLPARNAKLLPDEYVRIYNLGFHQKVVSRFNEASTPAELTEIAALIGADYALAYSPAFVHRLKEAGFQPTASLHPSEMDPSARALLELPSAELVLLRSPGQHAILSPSAAANFEGSNLTWNARAGQSYTVRYMSHPDFHASQNNQQIEVESTPAAAVGGLHYMTVRAVADGPLQLSFRSKWL